MAGLTRDQPRPPPGPLPGRTDPRRRSRRQLARRGMRTRRAIHKTRTRRTLLLTRRPITVDPPLRRRLADAMPTSRLPPRHTATNDQHHHRPPTSRSELRVTVQPHPGSPPSSRVPSQTHSLEGGPDGLLNRSQRPEARHLEGCARAGATTVSGATMARAIVRKGAYCHSVLGPPAGVQTISTGPVFRVRHLVLLTFRPAVGESVRLRHWPRLPCGGSALVGDTIRRRGQGMRFRILFGAATLLTSLGAAAATGLVGTASAAAGTAYTCTGGNFATGHFTSIPSGNYASITVKGVCNIVPNAVINVIGNINVAAGAVLDAQSAPSTITVGRNVTAGAGSLLGMGCQPTNTIGMFAGVPCARPSKEAHRHHGERERHRHHREHHPAAQLTVGGNIALAGGGGDIPWSIKGNTSVATSRSAGLRPTGSASSSTRSPQRDADQHRITDPAIRARRSRSWKTLSRATSSARGSPRACPEGSSPARSTTSATKRSVSAQRSVSSPALAW